MMKTIPSHFHFLGSRSYVQGSTLFDGAMSALKEWQYELPSKVEVDCRSIIEEQGVFELLDLSLVHDLKSFDSLFKFTVRNEPCLVGLKRNGDKNLERVPYDEDGMVEKSSLTSDQKTILFKWNDNLPMMKVFIALFKKMLLETQSSKGFGKWIFYKADLNLDQIRNFKEADLSLTLKSMIGGSSAKAHIYFNGEEVGKIYFNRQKL